MTEQNHSDFNLFISYKDSLYPVLVDVVKARFYGLNISTKNHRLFTPEEFVLHTKKNPNYLRLYAIANKVEKREKKEKKKEDQDIVILIEYPFENSATAHKVMGIFKCREEIEISELRDFFLTDKLTALSSEIVKIVPTSTKESYQMMRFAEKYNCKDLGYICLSYSAKIVKNTTV